MADHDLRSQGASAEAPAAPPLDKVKGGGGASGLGQAVAGVSSNAGLLGLHMVSSTAVGLAMGWFLDDWLGTRPWLLIVFLCMGIVEGFRNMWREAQRVRRQDEAVRAAHEAGEALPETPESRGLTFFKKDHFTKTYASPVRQASPVGGESAAPVSPVTGSEAEENRGVAGEKSDEVLDEEALRQALIRELQEAKADPYVAEALRSLLRQGGAPDATEAREQDPETKSPQKAKPEDT